jgi:hypothetical protein
MRSVGLKTLKNKLSEYAGLPPVVRRLWSPIVTVLLRKLVHLAPARSSMLSDALLLDAFRQGWMTPPISVGRGI